MLKDQPVSVTTPYARSKIPNPTDVARIANLSNEFFVTRDPSPKKPPKKEKMVDQEMNSIATRRYLVKDKMGHVQIRFDLNNLLDIYKNQLVVNY